MVYWYPTNILTPSFEGTIRLEVLSDHGKDMKIIDAMDGSIYEIPDELIEEAGNGVYNIQKLPIKDTPLLITFETFGNKNMIYKKKIKNPHKTQTVANPLH